MDCNEVQAYLKFRTLGHEQHHERDAAEVNRHLAHCDGCHSAFVTEQAFDHEVASAMSEVAIPGGLTSRLRNVIRSVDAPVTADRAAIRPRRRLSRRIVLAAMAAGLAAVIISKITTSFAPLTESEVRRLVDLNIESLPAAAVDAAFPLPAGWDRVRGLQFAQAPLLATIGQRQFPILPLIVRLRSKSPEVAGFLVRIPSASSQPAIDATSFHSATVQYSSTGSWVIWREANAVYVCVLRDAHTMERLQNAIFGGREFG